MSLNGDSPVVRVFGSVGDIDHHDVSHPAPENTVAQLLFENGVHAIWSTGPISPTASERSEIWAHCRLAVYAEKGRTLWEEFNRWQIGSPEGLETGSHTKNWANLRTV